MPRDFTISIDPSRLSGSVDSNTVYVPFSQHVNSVINLKNTNTVYSLSLGSTQSAEKESIIDLPQPPSTQATRNLTMDEIDRELSIRYNLESKKSKNNSHLSNVTVVTDENKTNTFLNIDSSAANNSIPLVNLPYNVAKRFKK